jgi:pyruvate kinase
MYKIHTICTIGPTSEIPEVLERLVIEGMDIARFNMSHATHEQFTRCSDLIAKFNKQHGKNVKILMDLQGPRLRFGEMPKEGRKLVDGEEIIFSTDPEDKDAIFINDPYLHEDVQVHQPLYLSSGEMELLVTKKEGSRIHANVVRGGILFSRKGVNVPDTKLTTRGLTEKDIKDLHFGVENGADIIAMSFVQDGEDMKRLRELIDNSKIQTCAKMELRRGVLNLEDILEYSDLIMVARGDLGVELPLEELPLLQKYMIQQAGRFSTKSIVATQMLMSMVDHPSPTRAEVSDVANAVMDGAWAVMLSDETAFGKYPVEALQYLVRTVKRVEKYQTGALPQLSSIL